MLPTQDNRENWGMKLLAVRTRVSLALIFVFWIPAPAWAGRSTEGLIYLFLPFYVALAIFLLGTVVALAYLMICRRRAKKKSFMDIARAKIVNRGLLRLWSAAVLIWIMVILFNAPDLIMSADTFLFGAILVAVPCALIGVPLVFFASINSHFSR